MSIDEKKQQDMATVNATSAEVKAAAETGNSFSAAAIDTAAEKTSFAAIAAALINGSGVGLLLGVLLGSTVSPVVSGVVTALTGLLAVLLGVNEKYISPTKSVRIGAFGFFCVGGIYLGLYNRVNNGMMDSRTKMLKDYTDVGFTKKDALGFIAYREFSIRPPAFGTAAVEKTASPATPVVRPEMPATEKEPAVMALASTGAATPKPPADEPKKAPPAAPAAQASSASMGSDAYLRTVLMSSRTVVNLCQETVIDEVYSEGSAARALATLRKVGNDRLSTICRIVEATATPQEEKFQMLLGIHDAICKESIAREILAAKSIAVLSNSEKPAVRAISSFLTGLPPGSQGQLLKAIHGLLQSRR